MRDITDKPSDERKLEPGSLEATEMQEAEELTQLSEAQSADALSVSAELTGMPDSSDFTESDELRRQVGSSTALMSFCVILSRLTGFARTWAMAFALGSTFLSSSYQVANNLPNMLYELVMGGMLVTAFLPVYVNIKHKLGEEAGNRYASNLLSIVVVFLGVLSVIGMVFPQAIVYTQTFYSSQETMGTAVLLFQFFAIQMVFYGASSIVSGLLNANRNYFWSSIAPVANNAIVIVTFIAYALIAPTNQTAALYVIAVGNPLGVACQVMIQLPALKRNGIHLRPRVDLHDPALRETLSLGVPAFLVMVCSFATVSVMNAASYCFADDGPSIIAYARLWYVLPYSLLAIPISTALFTELSHMHSAGDQKAVASCITLGTSQILFLLIPFTVFLIVFSLHLVSMYHIGAFTMENVSQIAGFLCALSLALPGYGLSTFYQKVFSSIRRLGIYSAFNFVAGAVQIGLTALCAWAATSGLDWPIESIGWASAIFFLVLGVLCLIYLKRTIPQIRVREIVKSVLLGLGLGVLGGAAGYGVLWLLTALVGDAIGSVVLSLAYVLVGGAVAFLVAFGPAMLLRLPEAEPISAMIRKVLRR